MFNRTMPTKKIVLPPQPQPKAYASLLKLREAKNISLKLNPYIKDWVDFRYYQVIGIMHLLKMSRLVLGDGTGLGKCVTGDTLIHTDRGLLPIRDIGPKGPLKEGFYPAEGKIFLRGEWLSIKNFYYSGVKPTRKVNTSCGYSVEGSLVHPLLVRTSEGVERFKRLLDFSCGDRVCISRDIEEWPGAELPTTQDTVPTCQALMARCWGLLKNTNTERYRDPSFDTLRELQKNLLHVGISDPELDGIIENHYFYDTVETLVDGEAEVMDLEIDDDSHAFVGNGFINHNTIEIIGAYSYMLEKDPTLKLVVISPKSATSQWVDEFDKFTQGINCKRLENFGKPSRVKQYKEFWEDPKANVLVMHYHFYREDYRLYEQYLGNNFMLVMDEVTACKTPKSKTHKVAKMVSAKARRCYGLTATLLKNSLLEGFGIFKVVYPPLFSGITKFKSHYCIEKKMKLGNRRIPMVVGYKNVDHFRLMIDPFFLGRNKYDVSDELPDLVTKEIACGLSNAQWDLYTQALGDILVIRKDGEDVEKEMTTLTRIGYFQQIVNHPECLGMEGTSDKEKELYRLINEDLMGEKVIIFSKYKKMINIIQRELEHQGHIVARITGDENEHQRTLNKLMFSQDLEALQRFLIANVGPKADPRTKRKVLSSCKTQLRLLKEKKWPDIILLTPAGTEALNLQAAGVFIFYDNPWSPGDYDQLLGRMIRIGSIHSTVVAFHLMCKGTIDDYVLATLRRKSKVIKQVLGVQTKGALEFDTSSDFKGFLMKLQADAARLKLEGKSKFRKTL